MTLVVIARHGNTFDTVETPRRVGRRTDLPLTATGELQAAALGEHWKARGLIPDVAFTATLKRTRDTARLALSAAGATCTAKLLPMLDEIDYGPDENQPEKAVVARIGAEALAQWEEAAVPPSGWQVDPPALIAAWRDFAASLVNGPAVVLAVTSNGIARFAPAIAGDVAVFGAAHSLKLATGAYGLLRHQPDGWAIEAWNIKP